MDDDDRSSDAVTLLGSSPRRPSSVPFPIHDVPGTLVQSRTYPVRQDFFFGERRRQPWSPVQPDQTKRNRSFSLGSRVIHSIVHGTSQSCGELGDKADHNKQDHNIVHSPDEEEMMMMCSVPYESTTQDYSYTYNTNKYSTTTDAIAVKWFWELRSVAAETTTQGDRFFGVLHFVRSPFRVSHWVGRFAKKITKDWSVGRIGPRCFWWRG
jgi:hypothetical protein